MDNLAVLPRAPHAQELPCLSPGQAWRWHHTEHRWIADECADPAVTLVLLERAEDNALRREREFRFFSLRDFSLSLHHERRGPAGGKSIEDRHKNGPALVPVAVDWAAAACECSPVFSADQKHRHKGCFVGTSQLCVLDVDDQKKEDVAEALARLSLAGVAFLVWTTHAHGRADKDGAYPCRVVISLERAVALEAMGALRAAVAKKYGLKLDKNTRDPGRLFYLPSCPDDARRAAMAEVAYEDGARLDASSLVTESEFDLPYPRTVRGRLTGDPYAGQRRPLTREDLEAAGGDSGAALLVRQVARGEAWGTKHDPDVKGSGREKGLSDLAWHLCLTYPWLDPEGTAELFSASCAAVQAEDGAATEVWWVAEKLTRKLPAAAEEVERRAKLAEEAARAFPGLDSASGPPRDLVVQSETAYFLRGADGDLEGPWAERNVVTRARDLFADRTDISLRRGKEGNGEWKSGVQLARDYGTAVNSVVYDYGLKRSEVRGTTLAMHCAPLRDLEPRENPQIAEYLRLLGGEQHEQLLDWLATVLETTRATAGIYVCGPTGLGKSMLPLGLTRLWALAEGPCPFPQALDKFNLDVIRCPIVFADEDLKLPRHSHETPANALKRVIDQTKRRVEEKYVGRAELIGAYRVVITTNKTPVEIFQESLTSMDIGALDQRVLVLEPAPGCREYLEALGGHDTTDEWVEGCGIARHVLWLAQERGPRVVRGGRYLVPGAGFGALLAAGNEDSRAICQAVLVAIERQLADVVRVDPTPHTGVWVNLNALRERWKYLLPETPIPDDWSDAKDSACEPETVQLRADGVRHKYRRARPEVLAHVRQRRGKE